MTFAETIPIDTKGFSDIIDITPRVLSYVKQAGIANGLSAHHH